EMEGAAHEPRLREGLVLPERRLDVVGPAVNADSNLHLGGRHERGLDATDLPNDASELFLGCALGEMVAGKAKCVHLRPAESGGDFRLRDHPWQSAYSKSLRPRVTNWSRRGPVPTSSIGVPISSPIRSTEARAPFRRVP